MTPNPELQDHPLVDVRGVPPAAAAGQAAETRHDRTERAHAAGAEKSAAARRRAGNSSGGKHQRQVALIGLGDELPTVSLRTAEDQLRVLEAVLGAVARGRTSGMVAQTIIALVRAANQVLTTDQGQQIAELERRVADVLGSRTVTVR